MGVTTTAAGGSVVSAVAPGAAGELGFAHVHADGSVDVEVVENGLKFDIDEKGGQVLGVVRET